MQAIILAAGRGSRLRHLTADRPKCLVELAGRPLLAWQLASLRAAGIERITVVRGYLSGMLAGPGYATRDNPRWKASNMVTTLCTAADILAAEETVVSYSDIVYRPAWVQALAACPGDLAITYDQDWEALWRLRFADPLDDAETFVQKHGRLREIGGKPHRPEQIQGQYMGLFKLTPQGFAAIARALAELAPTEADRLDVTALLRRLLARGQEIHAVPCRGGWCEVDSQEDLAAYTRELARADAGGAPWSHDWRTPAPAAPRWEP